MHTPARITVHDDREICRLDVARSPKPIWATTSKGDQVFFVRMNNSARAMPFTELDDYFRERWPSHQLG
jgi:type I restriction enzyme R subunit